MAKRLIQTLTVLAATVLASAARASDEPKCDALYANGSVAIELCQKTRGNRDLVRVIVAGELQAGDSSTIINVRYPISDKKRRMWDRLWVASGSASLTEKTQAELRAIIASQPEALEREGLMPLLNVLSDMIEPGQAIESFEGGMRFQPQWWGNNYTMICESIGQERQAFFTANGLDVVSVSVVGDPNLFCRGRCGWGCRNIAQYNGNQYTQECLNHDACHDATGEQFGNCKDEFWAAVSSYVMAPNCN